MALLVPIYAGEDQIGGLVLGLAEGGCDVWGMGRRHPVDLSMEVLPAPFAATLAGLGISEKRWDQIIWDIRQQLSGCEDLYKFVS